MEIIYLRVTWLLIFISVNIVGDVISRFSSMNHGKKH